MLNNTIPLIFFNTFVRYCVLSNVKYIVIYLNGSFICCRATYQLLAFVHFVLKQNEPKVQDCTVCATRIENLPPKRAELVLRTQTAPRF